MKKTNFLKEYYKIVIVTLLLFSFYLIWKLLWPGFYTTCWWWGWINLCIIPSLNYDFTRDSYIWLFIFTISFFLIYLFKNSSEYKKKIKFSIIILLLGITWNILSFLIASDFVYNRLESSYKNQVGQIDDVVEYINILNKYCINRNEGFVIYDTWNYICNWQDIYNMALNNWKDYIKLLNYTNNNFIDLYKKVFDRLLDDEVYYYDKGKYKLDIKNENINKILIDVIKNYKNKTFQIMLLQSGYSELNIINEVANHAFDNDVYELAIFTFNQRSYFEKNKISMKQFEKNNFYSLYGQEKDWIIKKIEWLDKRLIHYKDNSVSDYIKDLEVANNNMDFKQYNSVFYDLEISENSYYKPSNMLGWNLQENFYTKQIIREYNNKTFQVKLLSRSYIDSYSLLLREYAFDNDIIELLNWIDDMKKELSIANENYMKNSIRTSFYYNMERKIKNMKWINQSFFKIRYNF